MKRRRAEQKAQSKEHILRIAYEEFAKHGIVGTATLKIAKLAKISHGSIFFHFPNREALVLAVIDEFGKRLAEVLYETAPACQSIKDLLLCHVNVLEEFEPFYTHLVTESALLPAAIRNRIFLIQSGLATYLDKQLEREIRAGKLRPIPLPMLMNTWVGLLHYYLANKERFANGPSVLKEQKNHLVDFIISILLPVIAT